MRFQPCIEKFKILPILDLVGHVAWQTHNHGRLCWSMVCYLKNSKLKSLSNTFATCCTLNQHNSWTIVKIISNRNVKLIVVFVFVFVGVLVCVILQRNATV